MEWILTIFGLLVGIAGTFFTIFYGGKSKPLYSIHQVSIGLPAHPHLRVRFKNRGVNAISLIRFVVWNAGRREIRREDIPMRPIGPCVLLPEGTRLLDQRIIATTGDESATLTPIADGQLSLSFEFLNRGDAILGEILCEDCTEDQPPAMIKGIVKGACFQRGDIHNLTLFDHVFFVFVLLVMIAMSIIFGVGTVERLRSGRYASAGLSAMFTLLLIALTYLNLRFNILSIPKKLPREYETFLSDGTLPGGKAMWER
jgi:hypothetical protein